jgi:hypothetical protein
MKTKVSGHTQRSRTHNASSKIQSSRGQKIEGRKAGVPTSPAKRNGPGQSRSKKIETERRAKKGKNGPNTNGSAAENIRAADIAPAANKKPSFVRQHSKRTPGRVGRNGEAAAEQSVHATAVNDRTDPFDWGLNRIWLDWSYSMIPTALMTTKDLMRRGSPMDLMAIGSRRALSSWFDVWLQVLEGQRDRRTKP